MFAVQCCVMNDAYSSDPQIQTAASRIRWEWAAVTTFILLDTGFL